MKMQRQVLVAIVILTLFGGSVLPVSAQSPTGRQATAEQIEALKERVRKIGINENVTVRMLSGLEHYGEITKIEADRIEIFEIDLKQTLSIAYKDMKKVEKGYGKLDPYTGRRKNSRRHFWSYVAVAAGTAVLVGYILSPPNLKFPNTP